MTMAAIKPGAPMRWQTVYQAAALLGYAPDDRGRANLLKHVRRYESRFPDGPPILRRYGSIEVNSLQQAMTLLFDARKREPKAKAVRTGSTAAVNAALRSAGLAAHKPRAGRKPQKEATP